MLNKQTVSLSARQRHRGQCCTLPDESYGSLLSRKVIGSGNCSHDGDDELANGHSNGTHEKQVAATHLLDKVETREGGGDVDTAVDVLAQVLRECSNPKCCVWQNQSLHGKIAETMVGNDGTTTIILAWPPKVHILTLIVSKT